MTRRRLAVRSLPVVLLTVACLGLGSCGSDEVEGAPPTVDPAGNKLGHVHGLGVDPADDTLYVASHFGVYRVENGKKELVADRQQDTMGFAVVGPGHFLGSGHPDPDEKLPPSLGLVESLDAGETWKPVSLLGEADLHSIELVGDRLYAFESSTQALIVTDDLQRWSVVSELLPLLDLATNPDDQDTVYATGSEGELLKWTAEDRDPTALDDAPPLTMIDWETDGPLVGVGPDGTVWVSADGESDWQEAGTLDGPVEALDVIAGRWHAATRSGVHESTDDGATWDVVLTDAG